MALKILNFEAFNGFLAVGMRIENRGVEILN